MSWAATDPVLRALAGREPIEAPVAVVVAHPDDETIGAGASLRLFRRLVLVHVTDGAPRDLRDARAAGFETCADYASARVRELRDALDVGQCRPSPPIVDATRVDATRVDATRVDATRVDATVDPTLGGLPLPDQTASFHLGWLAAALRAMLRGMSAVITHAYEGGHPDHDAVAFAVQAAGLPTIEMAGYHAAPGGGIEIGRFLPDGRETVVPLTEPERARRDAMLACFRTQRTTLMPFFGRTEERFRPAPRYDFTRPAAPRTYYDGFDWGLTSERWCALAAQALSC